MFAKLPAARLGALTAGVFMICGATAANAALIGVAGPNSSDGTAPAIVAAPNHVLDDFTNNDGMRGFDEAQGVVTSVAHGIDGGGFIAAGTIVNSHMIFLNSEGEGAVGHFNVDWTFDGTILGIMSDAGGTLEAASTFELGNPATNYTTTFFGSGPAAPFALRGLDGNDGQGDGPNDGYFLVNDHTLRVGMFVTEPGDWIRVVTGYTEPTTNPDPNDVPEPGTLALFGLGLVGLAFARRRKTALRNPNSGR